MTGERFRELVIEHRDRVYTLARYLLRDATEAEDVTQDVFLRLWNSPPEESDNLGPWLLRVTRNRAIDGIRRRQRGPIQEAPQDEDETFFDRVPAPDVAPDRQAEISSLGTRLHSAVHGLPEPYRSVILLREVQGRSYQEIAEILGIALGTVKIQLHRARRRLRDELSEEVHHAYA